MLSEVQSLVMWGASVIMHWDPPVNLWTTDTVGQQFALSVHIVQFVTVILSVSLSVSLSQ
jgi:hypothetical protein